MVSFLIFSFLISYTALAKTTNFLYWMNEQENILFKYQRVIFIIIEISDGDSNFSMATAEMATRKLLSALAYEVTIYALASG